MELKIVISVIVSIFLAGVGWYVVHHLTVRRARLEAKREKRLDYLINLYRTLYDLACDGLQDQADFENFRNAINDIHLFGTPRHIDIAQSVIQQIQESGGKVLDLGLLLAYLQDDLRQELGLKKIDKYGAMMSWGDDKTRSPSPSPNRPGASSSPPT